MVEQEQNDASVDANWQYTATSGQESLAGSDLGQNTSSTEKHVDTIEWTASEYVQHEKDARWYGALIVAGVVITALTFFITRQDILATVTVFIAFIAIIVYAGRKPDTKHYAVHEKGVKVGDKEYAYSEFRSFSVVEEGAIDSIWLKPLKRFAPAVVIYFSPEDEEKIIDTLSVYLPHEDRELDAIDKFSKKVRF